MGTRGSAITFEPASSNAQEVLWDCLHMALDAGHKPARATLSHSGVANIVHQFGAGSAFLRLQEDGSIQLWTTVGWLLFEPSMKEDRTLTMYDEAGDVVLNAKVRW